MKVSCDVSCVQLAMRHCHNAENGGKTVTGAQNSVLLQGESGGRRGMSVGLSRAHFLRFALEDTYVEAGELKISGSWRRTRTPW